jgi:F-type H+-transporting ATPase subunit epsilon
MGFKLEIVTPDRAFFSDEVDMAILRGIEGEFAVLKNMAPLITPLDIGKIRIKIGNEEKVVAIAGGYVTVSKDKTTVIADSAEWPEEIDVERAKRAKERAEKRLNEKKEGIDILRAELALKRAINRLNIAEKYKNKK